MSRVVRLVNLYALRSGPMLKMLGPPAGFDAGRKWLGCASAAYPANIAAAAERVTLRPAADQWSFAAASTARTISALI